MDQRRQVKNEDAGNMGDVIRIKRNHYVHLLDNNMNVTRCLVGPLVYTRQEHERCLFHPRPCVVVPPRCYCIIQNPCVRDASGAPVLGANSSVMLRMGEEEIRFEQQPFPLEPGEVLKQKNEKWLFKLEVIPANTGYHVRCLHDFTDENGVSRRAGMEWLVEGPQTYVPRIEVEVVQEVKAHIITPNTALHLCAKLKFTDRNGMPREAGELWMVRTVGAYLPAVEEEVVGTVEGVTLTNTEAVQLEALATFTDVYGKTRMAGEKWLVTKEDASVHIPDVHEKVGGIVKATVLSGKEYCIVEDPLGTDGMNQFGRREVRKGECSFFLHPYEKMIGEVQSMKVLGKDQALLLQALDSFEDRGQLRCPGEKWMLHGPTEYVPDVNVRILEQRSVIALDKNEGIYVMDTTTGVVRVVMGEPYMLNENEVLWEKHLSPEVEVLLSSVNGCSTEMDDTLPFLSNRVRHSVVRFNVQHNAAVQIYDYKQKKLRVVLGPNLVVLSPDEEFTVLSLSGGKPKAPNAMRCLQLLLGPRFSSDRVVVETSDHARLELDLSYNWHFDVNRDEPDAKIFSVPDFIGDCCKTIASRVRGAVAAEDFDSFHRNSSRIIREAVFGRGENGEVNTSLRFTANNLVVTNIDIQSVEPTDAKTRESLQKSVQLAIEITTKSQEAAARHGKERKDQEARGKLERQKLLDKIEVERAKTRWLELQAQSEAVQASGQSVAEAKAKAESLLIEVESQLKQAEMRAKAYRITAESELKKQRQKLDLELEFVKRQNELEIIKARQLAETEAERVRRMVAAIGRDTIVAVAQAGPEMQAKLLGGLGLKGYLITDGKSPVNLFNTAQGLINGGVSTQEHP
ncbi:major vault protein [Trypanosoma rangeli]|uniref:Major vault protein n=2 Tax=Trypanosoma rangeli TaxID=5698 RepID=A0A422NYK3_TRYRA|nr:major vault protein [Trypanosoma rangeli]RNF10501.1 major vault protein [Trypanosoma rangeli]|eukprot:RNF10501.1 major vault protein [Trypanosoma rangeli]